MRLLTYRRPPPGTQRRLELHAAAARERLFAIHLHHALELVGLGADQISLPRALDIYVRLHGLSREEGRLLITRVLASLARPHDPSTDPDAEQPSWGDDEGTTLLGRLFRRLRGRRDPELRRCVEIGAGRAQADLLRAHVDHVLEVVEMAGKDWSVSDAVHFYMEMLDVRAPLYDSIYIATLDRLSRGDGEGPREESGPSSPRRPFRVLGGGG